MGREAFDNFGDFGPQEFDQASQYWFLLLSFNDFDFNVGTRLARQLPTLHRINESTN
jgi:hypothetical protein